MNEPAGLPPSPATEPQARHVRPPAPPLAAPTSVPSHAPTDPAQAHPPQPTDPAAADPARTIGPTDTSPAERRRAARAASIPALRYPAELPVTAHREQLITAIRDHQVLIVAGETGSGKSTQLPKLCLEAGRGLDGMIGHTQPRRLAARAVAERVASELGQDVGGLVGYAVRFTDRVSEATMVKVMTDGILLAEIQRDRQLRRYDTIIIDEAHERSLNIDFLLGYLTQLLVRRPELKLIITSATIDTERFAEHFAGHGQAAPIISVSGRTYPVELRYRPLEGDRDSGAIGNRSGGGNGRDQDRDQTEAILEAVDELCAEGPGDILVFLSGEREIRDTAEALRGQDRPETEILPLYARLSMAEQHRIFAEHRKRRIVLATNVAETSLTVPGIRGVIDAGTARISRYNRRTKVQRLPIEAISQASANQRAGRCGRIGPGVCIRLYAEDDFNGRPPFTEPEILRTNLASVILQMAALGLGDAADFPFVQPPERRAIKDGVTLLEELDALDPQREGTKGWLTRTGRQLARLPLDPRLGRMVLEADHLDCVREVSVITAALSIQDPRERPSDKEQAAAEHHRRFAHPDSDLLSYLKLWSYLQEQQHQLSSNAFRRMCRSEYLNYLRVREWQDLVSQLRRVTNEMGYRTNHEDPPANHVTRAILSGLLSQIGRLDPERKDYQGARGSRFSLARDSVLARRNPRWVMAAELVETNRLWARRVATIQPEWVEKLAPHLLVYQYSDPHWSTERAATVAIERVSLYGLPIITGRSVDFGRIDAPYARTLFIRHGLVEGDWQTHHRFVDANRGVLDGFHDRQHRLRRHVGPDQEALSEFYDARIGAEVTSGRRFDAWWKGARTENPKLLELLVEDLLSEGERAQLANFERDYPDTWSTRSGAELPLTYRFEPGQSHDGVTVTMGLGQLNQLQGERFDWSVPGMAAELVGALLAQLPKAERRQFMPVATAARDLLTSMSPAQGALVDILERTASDRSGHTIPSGTFNLEDTDEYLRLNFRVVDPAGRVLGEGRDLGRLQTALRPRLRATLRHAAPELERSGQQRWTFGTITPMIEIDTPAITTLTRPALPATHLDVTPGHRDPGGNGNGDCGDDLDGHGGTRRGARRRGRQRVPAGPNPGDLPDRNRAPHPTGDTVNGHGNSDGDRDGAGNGHPAPVDQPGLQGFPALFDEGESVGLRIFTSPAEQAAAHWVGTRRLLRLTIGGARQHGATVANPTKLAAARLRISTKDLLEDCVVATLDELLTQAGGPVWAEADFSRLRATVAAQVTPALQSAVKDASTAVREAAHIGARLDAVPNPQLQAAVDDMRLQLADLVHPGFVRTTGLTRLVDICRYLHAIDRRVDKALKDPRADQVRMAAQQQLEADFDKLAARWPAGAHPPEVTDLRWLLEELRVGTFAQSLGTSQPVSEKKLRDRLAELAAR